MKNKFFFCFRPPLVIETDQSHVLHSDNGISTSIIVAKNQKKSSSSTIKSTLLDNNQCIKDSGHNFQGKNMSEKRLISVKASLRNRVPDKNNHQLNPQSEEVISRKICKSLKDLGSDKSAKPKGIEANIQEISSDASSSSNIWYESKMLVPLSMKKLSSQSMPIPTDETDHMTTNTCPISYNNWGLIFITLALFLTIFWGKMIAILFALAWLYFFPLRQNMMQLAGDGEFKRVQREEGTQCTKHRALML
ncbi:Uncharacterized protein Fot_40687 [Forsythia ovata]|uniref:Uncharacterized protein n=1 Tax=Forsythia ovata TaxID=205694 RepID=A0ABD1S871_9LAMI